MKKPTPKCNIFMGINPKNFWAPSPDPTPGSEGGHPSETTTITGYSTKSKQKKIFRAYARWMLWYRRAHTSFRSKRTLDPRIYVPDIRLMTSRELTSGFDFWSYVISAWSWCICPPNLVQLALSNSELLTFSKIQDGGRCRLGFWGYVNFAIPARW